MSKGSFADMNCPIAQTLERVGEQWSLLILRNAFCGMTHFDEFQRHLGISSNVLSQRLRRLTAEGILTRNAVATDRRAFEYCLTDKGRALYPILVAMTEWGEKWAPHPKGRRIKLVERSTGESIAGLVVQSKDGRALPGRQLAAIPGPGADEKLQVLGAYSLAYVAPVAIPN